jgi:hypothetical protein
MKNAGYYGSSSHVPSTQAIILHDPLSPPSPPSFPAYPRYRMCPPIVTIYRDISRTAEVSSVGRNTPSSTSMRSLEGGVAFVLDLDHPRWTRPRTARMGELTLTGNYHSVGFKRMPSPSRIPSHSDLRGSCVFISKTKFVNRPTIDSPSNLNRIELHANS